MAPLLLLAVVFGLVAGFVMGWIGGRIYGRHEGRAALLRERCDTRPNPRQPAPVPAVAPAPQLPPAAPVVLVVQNQHPVGGSPGIAIGGYSQRLAELATHLAGEQARRLPGEPDAVTGHTVDARPALDGDVA